MGISKATGQWEGGLKSGKGSMKPAHAEAVGFSLGSRFEGQPASNPEEMVGAALAGCFSMALTAALERGGFTPRSVHTAAEVKLDKQDSGFVITGIALTSEASADGIDDTKFQALAEETKKVCPVSKALGGTLITLKASLKKG